MDMEIIAIGGPAPEPEEKHAHAQPFATSNHISFQTKGTLVELTGTRQVEATQKVSTMTEGHLIETTTMVRLYTGRVTINPLLEVFADATATVTSTKVEDLDQEKNQVEVKYTNEIVVKFTLPDGREMTFLAQTEVTETTCACPACALGAMLFNSKPTQIDFYEDDDLRLNNRFVELYLGEKFFTLA